MRVAVTVALSFDYELLKWLNSVALGYTNKGRLLGARRSSLLVQNIQVTEFGNRSIVVTLIAKLWNTSPAVYNLDNRNVMYISDIADVGYISTDMKPLDDAVHNMRYFVSNGIKYTLIGVDRGNNQIAVCSRADIERLPEEEVTGGEIVCMPIDVFNSLILLTSKG